MLRVIRSWLGNMTTKQAECGAPPVCRPNSRLTVATLEDRTCPAITFDFDYTFDTGGFFTAERKAAIAAAGDDMSRYLANTLSAVTPGGGNTWTTFFADPADDALTIQLSNAMIAANTIKVYVGSQDIDGNGAVGTLALASPGYNTTSAGTLDPKYRGNSTAFGASGYDSAWGGSLSIDHTWNWYSGSGTPGSGQSDLRTTVRHELGHLLGFRPGVTFNGGYSQVANGGSAPGSSGWHWPAGTIWDGQAALMDPSYTSGTLEFMTGLDYAGLKDIGWSVSAVIGTSGADSLGLTLLGGTTYRAAVITPGGTHYYDFDGSNGILVLGGSGNDGVNIGNASITGLATVFGGGGSDVLAVFGTGGSDSVYLAPYAGVVAGFVQINSSSNRVYLDPTIDRVDYYSEGGTDWVAALAGTTNSFGAYKTGGGVVVLNTYGSSANEVVGLIPGSGSTMGYRDATGLSRVYCGSTVDRVNYFSEGGGDKVWATLSATNQFGVYESGTGGGVLLHTYGSTGLDSAALVPGSGATDGYMQLVGSSYMSVFFGSTVSRVHYYTEGGNDVVYALATFSNTFGVYKTGAGYVTLNTYGTDYSDASVNINAATSTLDGSMHVPLTSQKLVHFGLGVDQVNFHGQLGNDSLFINNIGSTTIFGFYGGGGTDTFYVDDSNMTYVTLTDVENIVP